MPLYSGRAARYARAWLLGPSAVREEEVELDREGCRVPATIVRPARGGSGLPAWIALHGITPNGREHPQLTRFTKALVSSGAVVIVPEVPEWRALELAPRLATPTVRASLRALRASESIEGVAVIGFSFGAPHAIASIADSEIANQIAGAVGFGGYCDIHSTFRFMMGGDAAAGRPPLRPDPYGRWIIAANYLPALTELDGSAAVARALGDLAAHTGADAIPSWDACYDPVIERLRNGLDEAHRPLFDRFAQTSEAYRRAGRDRRPRPGAGSGPSADELATRLAEVAVAQDPTIDPRERLGRVRRPVHIVHGRNDRLISCEEAPRLRDALPADTPKRMTVTRVFAHSRQDPFPILSGLREVPLFFRALTEILDVP